MNTEQSKKRVLLVCRLPAKKSRYLVTIVDRQTGWPEAYPVKDISAETVAKVVVEGWISRFGCPAKLTSDQGRQFECSLFKELMRLLGVDKIRTTAYHVQANGMVERFHRSLKAALMARLSSSSWVEELSIMMLGLRTATRSDTGVSAAQMTYGTTLRLPGDFYAENSFKILDYSQYVERLRNIISNLKPKPVTHKDARTLFVHPDLDKVDYVFVRDDSVRKPLKTPYDGPYRVLQRGSKVYVVQLPGRKATISLDRLKPAYTLRESTFDSRTEQQSESREKVYAGPKNDAVVEPAKMLATRTSSYGRSIRRPVRFY